jgi:hypothetical protein
MTTIEIYAAAGIKHGYHSADVNTYLGLRGFKKLSDKHCNDVAFQHFFIDSLRKCGKHPYIHTWSVLKTETCSQCKRN